MSFRAEVYRPAWFIALLAAVTVSGISTVVTFPLVVTAQWSMWIFGTSGTIFCVALWAVILICSPRENKTRIREIDLEEARQMIENAFKAEKP